VAKEFGQFATSRARCAPEIDPKSTLDYGAVHHEASANEHEADRDEIEH
jgi:hypothetical protein